MQDINSVTLSGVVEGDASLKVTGSGLYIASATLVSTRPSPRGGGEARRIPVAVKFYGEGLAQSAARTLRSGSAAVVQGTLDVEEWKGRDGRAHRETVVRATGFQVVSGAVSAEGEGFTSEPVARPDYVQAAERQGAAVRVVQARGWTPDTAVKRRAGYGPVPRPWGPAPMPRFAEAEPDIFIGPSMA